MLMNKCFKFIVKMPIRALASNNREQTAMIVLEAPYLYMRFSLASHLETSEALRLLKAELKVEMIKALIDGEWEVQHE